MTSPIRPLLGLLLLFSVSGCAIARAQNQAQNQAQASTPAPMSLPAADVSAPVPQRFAQVVAQDVPIGRPERQTATADTTSVKVFQLDNQCEDFEGRVLTLPRATALNEAVGKAIETSMLLDFELAGYRVVEGPGFDEATVDFRIVSAREAAATPADAAQIERTLKSLSLCEGLALYGSIRRTLTDNGQFGVSRVRFTLAGEELR